MTRAPQQLRGMLSAHRGQRPAHPKPPAPVAPPAPPKHADTSAMAILGPTYNLDPATKGPIPCFVKGKPHGE